MRGRGVGRNVQCLGRVGRAGRTAANVCSGWVRGRLRYPETVPSWLRTSARAVGTNAERREVIEKTNREMEAVQVRNTNKIRSRGENSLM